ncbi:polysaccharide deacetylase family protein [Patescibacteria group bacterium]|nr:polysaccharide deacetylase family protein [Patescibacteria group bacterium]
MRITFTILAVLLLFFITFTQAASVQAASFRVPILMYHYIAGNPNPKDLARNWLSVPPDKFEAQMQYLSQNGYTPVSLDTLYGIYNNQASVPGKPIVLTFDDGYIDFYTNAFPILRRFNFHAVSFIPTGLIGKGYYMNWDQIKEIAASGLVTFEGHTVNHSYLPSLSYAAMLKQLTDSKNIIESNTGYPVNFISYPNGSTNGTVQAAARQAGYVGGVGTWYGKAWGPSLNMPRIRVSGFWTIREFAARI